MRKTLIKQCFLCNLFILNILSLITAHSAGFGETCNSEHRCDSQSFLACREVLAGDKCIYNATEDGKILSHQLPCIDRSSCENGICKCSRSNFERQNGTCESRHLYGGPCKSNEMCSLTWNLVCGNDSLCSCNSNHTYDAALKRCVKLAGESCTSPHACTPNAECNHVVGTSWICECKNSYYQTDEGTCREKGGYGAPCNENSECMMELLPPGPLLKMSTMLICVSGKCDCNQTISVPSNKNRIPCLKRPGLECSTFSYYNYNMNQCVNGAECKSTENWGEGICTCKTDYYTEGIPKRCERKKEHGEECHKEDHCQQDKKHTCKTDLYYWQRKCLCNISEVLHPESKMCLKKAGVTCETDNDCVPNAVCDSNTSKCTCVNGTSKSTEGHCHVREGEHCKSDSDHGGLTTRTCGKGLVCRNGICSCPVRDHQVYMEHLGKCQSLVYGPCNMTGDTRENCVENAECVEKGKIGVCRCKKGFSPVDRTCDLSYGENCVQGQTSPVCDRLAPLECSVRGKCECSDFQTYDKSSGKCKGLVGAKCDLNEMDFCLQSSFCKPFRAFKREFGICQCVTGAQLLAERKCGFVTASFSTIMTTTTPSVRTTPTDAAIMQDLATSVTSPESSKSSQFGYKMLTWRNINITTVPTPTSTDDDYDWW